MRFVCLCYIAKGITFKFIIKLYMLNVGTPTVNGMWNFCLLGTPTHPPFFFYVYVLLGLLYLFFVYLLF